MGVRAGNRCRVQFRLSRGIVYLILFVLHADLGPDERREYATLSLSLGQVLLHTINGKELS